MRIIILLFLTFSLQAHALSVNGFGIRYDHGNLSILNQQKLPLEQEWIQVDSITQMVEIISTLKVRGAPMIGIAAVLSLAQLAEHGAPKETIVQAASLLKLSRPTAVNLSIYIERIITAVQNSSDAQAAVLDTALTIYNEDVALCQAMGEAGAALIKAGENILTICNTGSLATAGIGTALGVIKTAHAQGKKIHVYVSETRPLLQGGRLTTWELQECGIPYTLICDNTVASLMKQQKIDRVLVGADRIAANGDFANKIGTYTVSVLAHHHKIPFHVVAPYTTIDPNCPNGNAIQIEQRSADEVRGVAGSFGKVCWTPRNAPVHNPAFDVTPASFVTSYILDTGSLSLDQFLNQ